MHDILLVIFTRITVATVVGLLVRYFLARKKPQNPAICCSRAAEQEREHGYKVSGLSAARTQPIAS
jgi:hypothetical protein